MNSIRKIAYGMTAGFRVLGVLLEARRQTIAASTEEGILTLSVNGEDFVRQGFASKDG